MKAGTLDGLPSYNIRFKTGEHRSSGFSLPKLDQGKYGFFITPKLKAILLDITNMELRSFSKDLSINIVGPDSETQTYYDNYFRKIRRDYTAEYNNIIRTYDAHQADIRQNTAAAAKPRHIPVDTLDPTEIVRAAKATATDAARPDSSPLAPPIDNEGLTLANFPYLFPPNLTEREIFVYWEQNHRPHYGGAPANLIQSLRQVGYHFGPEKTSFLDDLAEIKRLQREAKELRDKKAREDAAALMKEMTAAEETIEASYQEYMKTHKEKDAVGEAVKNDNINNNLVGIGVVTEEKKEPEPAGLALAAVIGIIIWAIL